MSEVFMPFISHWQQENYRERVTRKQAQETLLHHATLIFRGKLYDFKVKHIGAGIYELYKTPHEASQ